MRIFIQHPEVTILEIVKDRRRRFAQRLAESLDPIKGGSSETAWNGWQA